MDKPAGPTSHDVVARVRRRFGTRAVGHTGTLDPFATGLLILVLGSATRLARFVEGERKRYHAVVRLGVRTDTDDATGKPIGGVEPSEWPGAGEVAAALAGFAGDQLQAPPAFSAKHVGGERSHRLARRGLAVAPAPVPVVVHRIDLLAWEPPRVTFRAEVGAGTYIRALGRDLGERLGTGGHVESLRREAIGRFGVEAAVPLGALTGREPLLPPEELVRGVPGVALDGEEPARARHGRVIPREGPCLGTVALLDRGRLVAMAEGVPGGWHPVVVLPAEEQG